MTLVERVIPLKPPQVIEEWDKAMIEYQYRESTDGQHYVVLRGGNHEVIFTSELYKDKRDAKRLIQLMFDCGASMMPCQTKEKNDEGTADGARSSEEEPRGSGGEDVDGSVRQPGDDGGDH